MLEEVRESARHAAEMLVDYPDIADNELRTKNSLIEPFLRSLGYDTAHPEQVILEAPTDLGGKIDYVLTGETEATIAVEAKRAGLKLSDKETKQLRSYFTFSAAVTGILTNGVDYWLFTDLDKPNIMDLDPYRKIDIRQVTDNDLRQLVCLSRNTVSKDKVHEQARQQRHQSQINSIVAEELRAPSQEFLKLVGKKAEIKPLNKGNLAMLEPLVAEALRRSRGEPAPEVSPPPTAPSPKSETQKKSPSSPKTKTVYQGASLFGNPLVANNWAQMLRDVVAELQVRHPDDFDKVVSNPQVFRAKKYWMISKESSDLSSKRTKAKVGEFWVDTNLNAKNKIKRSHHFLKAFGYDPEDLVIHTQDDPAPA